jgi:hypothetical protein
MWEDWGNYFAFQEKGHFLVYLKKQIFQKFAFSYFVQILLRYLGVLKS